MPNPGARPAIGNCDCTATGSEIAQWLFWHNEDHRRLVRRREDHRLVDVALAGRSVAEIGHRDLVRTVALDAQGVSHRVQRLCADDDLQRRDAQRCRVVGRALFSSPHAHVVAGLSAACVDDPGLPVAGEHVVLRSECPRGPDLRRLLPLARRPEAQLSLALQRDALGIDAAQDDHVAQQRPQLRSIHVGDEGIQSRVRHTAPVRSQDAFGEFEILGGVCDGGDLR